MKTPKLIMLNGFAGSGKTTLKDRYLYEHEFALGFEGDVFITMIGGWKQDWHKAAQLKLVHSKAIVETHLRAGYDVVLPFLLQDQNQAEEYSTLATGAEADFYEVYLELPKDEAIARLYTRGRWGVEGSAPLTEDDRPKIEALYDRMVTATALRPNTVKIHPLKGAIDETYQALLKAVEG